MAVPASTTAHRLNRRAFGQIDANNALLQLYCVLVSIELALKDDAGSMGGDHDVVKLAKMLGDLSVEVAADGLDRALQQLWCTDKNNGRTTVPGRNYPYIRYLRHDTDFPGDTSQAVLEAARDAARQLDKELNRFWRGLGKDGVIP